jgi:hypothetical protein
VRPSSHRLAIALARRLNAVIPAGFRLTPRESYVELRIDGAWHGASCSPEIADDDARELEERLDTAVYGVLNSVQDSISEHLRTPWPSTDGRKMAMPAVRVGPNSIHLWYGESEAEAVLRLPEIHSLRSRSKYDDGVLSM